MSNGRRKFTTEFKVEAAHRVIDSGRSIVEVARELSLRQDTLGTWEHPWQQLNDHAD